MTYSIFRIPWINLNLQAHKASGINTFHSPFNAVRNIGNPPFRNLSTASTWSDKYSRTKRYSKLLAWITLTGGVVYVLDTRFYASSLTRTARSFATGAIVSLDYKINFRPHPPLAKSIAHLHARNAGRLDNLLRENGGLYLKIGQAIAMQSAVLPPEFQRRFAKMFDDAPQNDWKDVEGVIREDFGRSPEEVFGVSFNGEPGKGVMERVARASASVAQVHWARLPDGREVAVKVQKKEIKQQVGWDLWAFKAVMYITTKLFDLPFYNLVPYISTRLLLETDFENEADNAERMANLVANESRLRDRVYIPKVYKEYCTKRVMTAEWIEGVRLWDKEALTAPWKGGKEGSPGCHGAPMDSTGAAAPFVEGSPGVYLKPDRGHWKGAKGGGGLGLRLKDVMTTMVDLFSAQMFLWGWVHCDPHPGNIFIRRQPSGNPELVLIDHGLYVHLEPTLRHEYATFWKSLLTFDNATLGRIAQGWGISNADIFASATLMRPYTGGDMSTTRGMMEALGKDESERAYAMQVRARQGLRDILGDETKWPRELIFLGRNMRIVQGNNQFLGSPVNRIKITGTWASRALVDSTDLTLGERLRNFGRHLVFRLVLLSSDLMFYTSKLKQTLGFGKGMEDDLEAHMREMAKGTFGVELNHSVFDG
ncbi:ABC1 domain protein [Rickenella mellea]|uniref:ABC1 domain protein n=1 Tax=Rickenella mellea TaxID=50990 RepID=A0A4Y7PY33_9AGAM|nr:ABC1 domain protein [Rickenella mellea]